MKQVKGGFTNTLCNHEDETLIIAQYLMIAEEVHKTLVVIV